MAHHTPPKPAQSQFAANAPGHSKVAPRIAAATLRRAIVAAAAAAVRGAAATPTACVTAAHDAAATAEGTEDERSHKSIRHRAAKREPLSSSRHCTPCPSVVCLCTHPPMLDSRSRPCRDCRSERRRSTVQQSAAVRIRSAVRFRPFPGLCAALRFGWRLLTRLGLGRQLRVHRGPV